MREKDFAMLSRTFLVAMLIGFIDVPSAVHAADPVPSAEQARLLSNVRQVTFEGRRSGEGYFSADGSKMIFQSERDPKNPFYQIFVLDLNTGNTKRVSTGTGKTTCPWLHPDGKLALFASTHDDPDSLAKQQVEIDRRASGKTKRYEWDYDEHYEIYSTKLGSGKYENLTRTRGYDAEGSFSPDGKWIAFASNRHAYTDTLSEDDRHLLEIDAKVFLEIYIMRADGSEVKRLTDVMGYDGGPFFSPDGKRICWRRFTPDGNTAEIWTMNIDGTDPRQITRLGNMSWAPFYHPSGEYLIFTTDINGRSNFELYIVDVDGKKDPVRASNLPAFDGLPVFFPDGKRLAWTSNRTPNKKGQLFFADFNDAKARELLSLAADRKVTTTDSSKKSARKAETSRTVTAQDAAFHRERISAVVEEHNNAGAGIGYVLETLASFGFVDPDITKDEKGNIAFGLSLRPPEPTGREPLYVYLTLDKPTSQEERKEFASQLACFIEIGEYLAFEARNNAGGLARTLTLLVVFKTDRSDDGTWFTQASEGFGEGYAAAIEIRGLTHRSGKYVIDGVGTSPRWSRLLERLNVSIGLP
ncbi:MAG: hypothetical protein GXP29_05005, partial [Planctomycetes bacterium]|nr:hypothetical protein [Planctomycetota bacterium]